MPKAQYTDRQKEEAMGLIKDMIAAGELTDITPQIISDRTEIPYGTILRWVGKERGERSERDSDTTKSNGKSRTDYKTNYEMEKLRSQYLSKGLDLPQDQRLELEVAYLRSLVQTVSNYHVEPLFTQHTVSVIKKAGRPRKNPRD